MSDLAHSALRSVCKEGVVEEARMTFYEFRLLTAIIVIVISVFYRSVCVYKNNDGNNGP